MSTLALRRKDSPLPVEFGDDDLVAQSAALLVATGHKLVPLAQPMGPWSLLARTAHGLVLVAVVKEYFPDLTGAVLGRPLDWPPFTAGLLLVWKADAALPQAHPLF